MAAPDLENDAARHWFLAQLKPGGFGRARTNLSRQGIDSFMPQRRVTRRRAGRLAEAERPLFPGYLFVRVAPDAQTWRAINATYGVAKLVGFGAAGPAEVPPPLIAGLLARTGPDERLVTREQEFGVGERVRIVAGPFADMLARIEEIPEAGRIYALLEMMGRSVRTEVAPGHLERL